MIAQHLEIKKSAYQFDVMLIHHTLIKDAETSDGGN
jgi:hypothetical protein